MHQGPARGGPGPGQVEFVDMPLNQALEFQLRHQSVWRNLYTHHLPGPLVNLRAAVELVVDMGEMLQLVETGFRCDLGVKRLCLLYTSPSPRD